MSTQLQENLLQTLIKDGEKFSGVQLIGQLYTVDSH